jgi:hypothetical protein
MGGVCFTRFCMGQEGSWAPLVFLFSPLLSLFLVPLTTTPRGEFQAVNSAGVLFLLGAYIFWVSLPLHIHY